MIGDIMANLGNYGLKREEVFLTTKLSMSLLCYLFNPIFVLIVLFCFLGTAHQGKGNCRKAILEQIKDLQVTYVDMVLIHFPGSSQVSPGSVKNATNRQGSWEDLEQLVTEGLVRSIGVSNYEIKHLEELLKYAKIKPVVNQARHLFNVRIFSFLFLLLH